MIIVFSVHGWESWRSWRFPSFLGRSNYKLSLMEWSWLRRMDWIRACVLNVRSVLLRRVPWLPKSKSYPLRLSSSIINRTNTDCMCFFVFWFRILLFDLSLLWESFLKLVRAGWYFATSWQFWRFLWPTKSEPYHQSSHFFKTAFDWRKWLDYSWPAADVF